jgi:DNA-binding NtrC family response regulator
VGRRRGDPPLLFDHLVRRAPHDCGKQVTGVSESALALLQAYRWPGNVRELAHVLERGVALAQHDVLTAEDLPAELREPSAVTAAAVPADRPTLQELKRRYVRSVLEEQSGNVSRAAAVLGVDRRSLYRMLQRWGMVPRGRAIE